MNRHFLKAITLVMLCITTPQMKAQNAMPHHQATQASEQTKPQTGAAEQHDDDIAGYSHLSDQQIDSLRKFFKKQKERQRVQQQRPGSQMRRGCMNEDAQTGCCGLNTRTNRIMADKRQAQYHRGPQRYQEGCGQDRPRFYLQGNKKMLRPNGFTGSPRFSSQCKSCQKHRGNYSGNKEGNARFMTERYLLNSEQQTAVKKLLKNNQEQRRQQRELNKKKNKERQQATDAELKRIMNKEQYARYQKDRKALAKRFKQQRKQNNSNHYFQQPRY